MASYAPLFINDNDHTLVVNQWLAPPSPFCMFMLIFALQWLQSETIRWNPDAIVFNSWQQYGTPSYWMQKLFRESSGAMFHPIIVSSNYSGSLAASAITWHDNDNSFLRVKVSKNFFASLHTQNCNIIVLILEAHAFADCELWAGCLEPHDLDNWNWGQRQCARIYCHCSHIWQCDGWEFFH